MVVLLPAAVCLSDGAHPFQHQLIGLHQQFLQTIQALKVEAYTAYKVCSSSETKFMNIQFTGGRRLLPPPPLYV